MVGNCIGRHSEKLRVPQRSIVVLGLNLFRYLETVKGFLEKTWEERCVKETKFGLIQE